MIACSCNWIKTDEVETAAAELRRQNPGKLITPGMVYRHLGYMPQCGGCFPLIVTLIRNADRASAEDEATGTPESAPSDQSTL